MNSKRPVNLDLSTIQFPLPALTSIAHRITGVILFIGLIFGFWALDASLSSPEGFAAVSGKPMRLTLQAVGPRVDSYFDRPFGDAPRETRLVVIGQAGLDRVAIEKALAA